MPLPQATRERFWIIWRAAGAALGTVGRDLGAEGHTEVEAADTSIAAGYTHPPRPALAGGVARITRIVVHQQIEIDANSPWDQIGRRRADTGAPEIVRAEELLGVPVGTEVGGGTTASLARRDKLIADFFGLADLSGSVAADLVAVDGVRPRTETETVDTFEADRTSFRDAARTLTEADVARARERRIRWAGAHTLVADCVPRTGSAALAGRNAFTRASLEAAGTDACAVEAGRAIAAVGGRAAARRRNTFSAAFLRAAFALLALALAPALLLGRGDIGQPEDTETEHRAGEPAQDVPAGGHRGERTKQRIKPVGVHGLAPQGERVAADRRSQAPGARQAVPLLPLIPAQVLFETAQKPWLRTTQAAP
jgi:hypothetical protein